MKSYSSRDIIQILEADGWYYEDSSGSHNQYKHTTKKGKVTVPHPRKDIPVGTVRNIFSQAGIKIS